jgi:signal transduction histidine kinase
LGKSVIFNAEGKDAFSSEFHTLSHDLRTPLNHINGFAELLLLYGGLDATQATYVDAILRASQTLQATVLRYLEKAQPAVAR